MWGFPWATNQNEDMFVRMPTNTTTKFLEQNMRASNIKFLMSESWKTFVDTAKFRRIVCMEFLAPRMYCTVHTCSSSCRQSWVLPAPASPAIYRKRKKEKNAHKKREKNKTKQHAKINYFGEFRYAWLPQLCTWYLKSACTNLLLQQLWGCNAGTAFEQDTVPTLARPLRVLATGF